MSAERVTHGQLPHWYKPGYAHFVTYRLADSISPDLMRLWRIDRAAELNSRPVRGVSVHEHRERVQKRYFQRFDEELDRSESVNWLADERIAEIVRENLYHFHGDRYELLSYAIMPNHVHIVIQPFDIAAPQSIDNVGAEAELRSGEVEDSRSVLSRIMHSLKSYTANRANEILRRSGEFWQRESYDHWIRDLDELERIVQYIAANPVKAGLCSKPHEWRFSSTHDVLNRDGTEFGLVGRLRDDWKR
jgi:REP element-mobilizing transposase RayT